MQIRMKVASYFYHSNLVDFLMNVTSQKDVYIHLMNGLLGIHLW